MANAAVAKGSTVEVCSEDPGFHGAWYVATLLDELKCSPSNKKSSNKNTKEIQYLVKYDTLLGDDTLGEPLTEIVSPSCVRPLPPRNLRRNNLNYVMGAGADGGGGGSGGEDFELYDVIDAYHREGWWIGVVNKGNTVAGTRKYVVSFENPPEEVEFGRSQLRLHVDWIDGRWQFPPKKIPEDKSESNNDAHAGLTTPSKGSGTTDVDSSSMGLQPSTATKTRLRKNIEKSSEKVGAVKDSDSSGRNKGSKGNTNHKASVMEKSSSDAVNQDSPLTESETNKITTTHDVDNPTVATQPSSVTKSRARKDSERSSETVGVVKASDISSGGKGNTKAKASVMEKSRSDAVSQDSPLMESERNSIIKETCEAEDGQRPQKKKRGRPPKLRAKEPISLQQGGSEITVDLDDQPSQLAGLKRSSSSRPGHHDETPSQPTVTSPGPDDHDEPPSQPTVTGPGPDHHDEPVETTTDYQHNWPFIKRSPIWAAIASLKVYQTPPQRPHFSPLKKIKADHREGLAVAHMVTFGNLVQMCLDIKLTDPVDQINNSLEILTDLESHGFDVGTIRGRLNQLLSLKSKASQHTIKLKAFEEEFEKCNGEKCVEEKEINELEMKMKELQEKMVQKLRMKKVRDEEMMGLQSNMNVVSEQISDCELAFKKLATTPL